MTEAAAAAPPCPHSECKDAPFDGMHFTGGFDAQGVRYYREFDGGCPWVDEPLLPADRDESTPVTPQRRHIWLETNEPISATKANEWLNALLAASDDLDIVVGGALETVPDGD